MWVHLSAQWDVGQMTYPPEEAGSPESRRRSSYRKELGLMKDGAGGQLLRTFLRLL